MPGISSCKLCGGKKESFECCYLGVMFADGIQMLQTNLSTHSVITFYMKWCLLINNEHGKR